MTDELAQRLGEERAKHAQLEAQYSQLVASEGEVLAELSARCAAATQGLLSAKRARRDLELAAPRLRREVRALSGGLGALRLAWVRLGEPTLSALAPLVSLVLLVAGEAVPLQNPFLHVAPLSGAACGVALALVGLWSARK